MKKYIVQMRDSNDGTILEVVGEFDSYSAAEACMDEQSCGLATGAEIMELSGMIYDEDYEYTDPNDVYFCIEEDDDD